MDEILCKCGGKLKFDPDETKKNGLILIYYCKECGALYYLEYYGQKEIGWKTKKFLEEKKKLDKINSIF